MTKKQYDNLTTFPVEMVTNTKWATNTIELRPGDTFIGIRKETIGKYDYSIIDHSGRPHYYTGCDLLYID